MSKGSDKIASIFKTEHIVYETEKQFTDLKRGKYRYDFYLPFSRVLVEFDGEQHFSYVPIFYRTRQDFLQAQERDRKKNIYALAMGIPLYRVPYWEIGAINSSADIFQDKFLVRSQFHNDNIKPPK